MNNSGNLTNSVNTFENNSNNSTNNIMKIKFSLEGDNFYEILTMTRESFLIFDFVKRELNEDLKKKKRKFYDESDDFMYKIFLTSDDKLERVEYVIKSQVDLDKPDIIESLKTAKNIKIEYKFTKIKGDNIRNLDDLKKFLYRKNLYLMIQYYLNKFAKSNNDFKEYIKKEYLNKLFEIKELTDIQVDQILGCAYEILKEQIELKNKENSKIYNSKSQKAINRNVSDGNLEYVKNIMFELSPKKSNKPEIRLDEEFQSMIENKDEEINEVTSKVFDDNYELGYSYYFNEKNSVIRESLNYNMKQMINQYSFINNETNLFLYTIINVNNMMIIMFIQL